MKKIFSLFALLCLSLSVFAQDGYFFTAGVGAGSGSSSFKPFSADAYNNHGNIFSYQLQMGIGYQKGNWQLQTGIGYWNSGISFMKKAGEPLCGTPPTGTVTPTPNPEASQDAKYTIQNPHLVVPLILGYTLRDGKKISFTPGIGIAGVYNGSGMLSTTNPFGNGLSINYNYNTISLMLSAKFDVNYRINKLFSIWCSPSYQNMVTSLTTKVSGDYMSRTYDHAFLFNAGIKYNLLHAVKKG